MVQKIPPSHLPKRHAILYPILIYGIFSSFWIAFSDQALTVFSADGALLTRLQTLKGWGFVLITSALLYGLLKRLYQSLEQSYSLLHDVLEGAADGIFVRDEQGQYVLVNQAAADLMAQPKAQILGQTLETLLPPGIANQLRSADQVLHARGQVAPLEVTLGDTTDPHIYWVDKRLWRDRRGEVKGIVDVMRDITAQKALMAERDRLIMDLRQQNQDLDALNQVTANAISTLELPELLDVLLRRIVNVTTADVGSILLREGGRLTVRAGVGIPATALGHQLLPNSGFANAVLRHGELLYVADIDTSPYQRSLVPGWPETPTQLGIPLRHNGQIIGVLQLEWRQRRAISHHEMHLLEITAERCASAILNARLYRQTQQLQARLQLQIDRMPLACILLDPQLQVTAWNPAAIALFGYDAETVLGAPLLELVVPASARSLMAETLQRLMTDDATVRRTYTNQTQTGRLIVCEWHSTPLRQADGSLMGLMVMVQDVTEQRRLEAQLHRYAFYDPPTGLPQRRLLLEQLKAALATPDESAPEKFALLYLHLDRFQIVKYSLGHDIAEAFLQAVVQRLEEYLPMPAMLARVGSDELGILLEAIAEYSEAHEIASRILRSLRSFFPIEGYNLFTQASIGIVYSQAPIQEAEALLRAADTAMHVAQTRGRSQIVVYDQTMQERVLMQLQREVELRFAIERQQMKLYYQPIVALDTLELVGIEALVRWQQPQVGLVPPEEFIPLSEYNGFITILGRWVLQEACQQMQAWRSRFADWFDADLNVNVSVVQLQQTNLVSQIEQVLQQTGLSPEKLSLEITETSVLECSDWVNDVLGNLRERRICLSADDFGTGYSSLSYLQQIQFDSLKIDKSFVQGLDSDPKSLKLVEVMLAIAQTLNLEVVAEGIETRQQLTILRQLGCSYGQGFLFAHPLDADGTTELLANGSWRSRL